MRSKPLMLAPAAGLLLFLAAILLRWSDGYEPRLGDYAQYLLHAKAMAEGRPYTETGYIYTARNTIAPPAYPPAVPAILAPAVAIGGQGTAGPRALMALFGAWFLIAVSAAIAYKEGALAAAAVVAVAGLSQPLVFFSTHIGSDVPFCAFVWALIAIADRGGRWSAARTATAAVLGAAAVLSRAAGVALIPAALVFWLLRRKECGLGPLLAAAAWAAAFGLMGLLLPVVSGYGDQAAVGAAAMLRGAVTGLFEYRYGVFDALLYPFPWNVLNDAYHLAGLLLVVIGLAAWIRRSATTFMLWFALAYSAVTILFPLHTTRYLLPLFPVFILGLLRGIEIVLRLALRVHAGRTPAAVAVCVAAIVALGGLRTQAVSPRVVGLVENGAVRELFVALEAQKQQRPALRAVFFNPRVLTWETGIPAMGLFKADPQDVIAEFQAKGITDVVLGDFDTKNPGTVSLEEAIAARPAAFRKGYSNAAFTMFRFEPGARDSVLVPEGH